MNAKRFIGIGIVVILLVGLGLLEKVGILGYLIYGVEPELKLSCDGCYANFVPKTVVFNVSFKLANVPADVFVPAKFDLVDKGNAVSVNSSDAGYLLRFGTEDVFFSLGSPDETGEFSLNVFYANGSEVKKIQVYEKVEYGVSPPAEENVSLRNETKENETLPEAGNETEEVVNIKVMDKDGNSIGSYKIVGSDVIVSDSAFYTTQESVPSYAKLFNCSSRNFSVKFDFIDDVQFGTKVIAFDREVNKSKVEIGLAKKAGKSVVDLFYCPDFDFDSFSCDDWVVLNVPFVDDGNQIRFEVEQVKGAYVGGISLEEESFEVKLLNNTDYCLVDCEAVLEVNIPYVKYGVMEENLSDVRLFDTEELIEEKEKEAKKKGLEIEKHALNSELLKVFFFKEKGSAGLKDFAVLRYVDGEWKNFSDVGFSVGRNLIKIKGKKKPVLGKNDVDWKIELNLFGKKVEPDWAWWRSDWKKRKRIEIQENSGTALYDYQVKVKIPFDEGMRGDFSDLRFTWINPGTGEEEEIDYWIEHNSSKDAILYVASDDGVNCYLNGHLIVEDWFQAHTYNYWNYWIYGEHLKPGKNVVACMVQDEGGSQYFDARLDVDDEVVVAKSVSGWKWKSYSGRYDESFLPSTTGTESGPSNGNFESGTSGWSGSGWSVVTSCGGGGACPEGSYCACSATSTTGNFTSTTFTINRTYVCYWITGMHSVRIVVQINGSDGWEDVAEDFLGVDDYSASDNGWIYQCLDVSKYKNKTARIVLVDDDTGSLGGFDDIIQADHPWFDTDYDDSSWSSGTTPFGNTGSYNTSWTGCDDCWAFFRKEFNLSHEAVVWLKIPYLGAGQRVVVYAYYNSSSPSGYGSPDNVFDFYDDFEGETIKMNILLDDFEDGYLDEWSYRDGNWQTPTIDCGTAGVGFCSVNTTDTNGGTGSIYVMKTPWRTKHKKISLWYKCESGAKWGIMILDGGSWRCIQGSGDSDCGGGYASIGSLTPSVTCDNTWRYAEYDFGENDYRADDTIIGDWGSGQTANAFMWFDNFRIYDYKMSRSIGDALKPEGGLLWEEYNTDQFRTNRRWKYPVIVEMKFATYDDKEYGNDMGFWKSTSNHFCFHSDDDAGYEGYYNDGSKTNVGLLVNPFGWHLVRIGIENESYVRFNIKGKYDNLISNSVDEEYFVVNQRCTQNYLNYVTISLWDWVRIRKYVSDEPSYVVLPSEGEVNYTLPGPHQFAGARHSVKTGYDMVSCDVNNDGYDDLIVSSYEGGSGGSIDGAGEVFVFLGPIYSVEDLDLNKADFRFVGSEMHEHASVLACDDFNGDGYDDIAIGAPHADCNGNESGRVYLVYTNGSNSVHYGLYRVGWLGDDTKVNNVTTNTQWRPTVATDQNNRIIIAWEDYRSGTNYDIYAKILDANGNVIKDDFVVTDASNNQYYPTITTDQNNRIIIAWQDYRSGTNYDIYAKILDANGNVIKDDFVITNNTANQYDPTIAVDQNNRIIIAWEDYRDSDWNIYAKILDSDGNIIRNDFAVTNNTATQWYPTITTDKNSRIIIAWRDYRNSATSGYDIYAKILDANGNVIKDDFAITTNTADQNDPTIAVDQNNRIIIAWEDSRSDSYYDIYAKILDSNGNTIKDDFKVNFAPSGTHQYDPSIITDYNNRIIIVWRDDKNGNYDIYAKILNSGGNVIENDFRIDQAPSTYSSHTTTDESVAVDQNGNIVVVWYDGRDGTHDIYYRKIIVGKLSEADAKICGDNANDWFGYSLDSGYVDNDNYADLFVGAPLENSSGVDSGSVYLI